jgi:hypothetical protein
MTAEQTIPVLQTQKIAVKIGLASGADLPLESFVPVFHAWIQQQAFHDHLLVDVADYKHVVNGPGVLLISHEANISIDETEGQRGLLYVRKQPIPQSFPKRIGQVVGYALELAAKLQAEPALAGKLTFATDRLTLRLQDRLLAPNTAATFEAVRPMLSDALIGALGGPVTLTHRAGPDRLFEVRVARA